jgi:hypothetical protein
METTELKNIWKAHDSILERSLKLNIYCIETIQSQKSKSKLKPLLMLRIFESIILLIILIFLAGFLFDNVSDIPVAVSAAILAIYNLYAFYKCFAQIALMTKISFSDSVTDIQIKLNLLQTHILDYFRLTFLMIPFWLVYPVIGFKILADTDIFNKLPAAWMISQFIILIPFSVYMYAQISYRNIHKRWVRFLIRNAGGRSVTESAEFLKVIDEFKKND